MTTSPPVIALVATLFSIAIAAPAQVLVSPPATKSPLILFNSTVIANVPGLPFDTKAIHGLEVYSGNEMPEILRGITPNAIVNMAYTGPVDSESFAELKSKLGLREPCRFVINGYSLTYEQTSVLRIMPEAIRRLQVVPAASATGPVIIAIELNDLSANDERNPPGTVKIR